MCRRWISSKEETIRVPENLGDQPASRGSCAGSLQELVLRGTCGRVLYGCGALHDPRILKRRDCDVSEVGVGMYADNI